MTFDISLHEVCVRVGVRYVITKFSRMDSLPNFLTHGAPQARASRARELRYKLSREALRSEFTTTNTKELVISENHCRRPRWYKFEFSFVGYDRQPSQKSGMRREKKVCFRLSQTIGDIYDFEFSLVDKIWDDRETVKFTNAWNFPHI